MDVSDLHAPLAFLPGEAQVPSGYAPEPVCPQGKDIFCPSLESKSHFSVVRPVVWSWPFNGEVHEPQLSAKRRVTATKLPSSSAYM